MVPDFTAQFEANTKQVALKKYKESYNLPQLYALGWWVRGCGCGRGRGRVERHQR